MGSRTVESPQISAVRIVDLREAGGPAPGLNLFAGITLLSAFLLFQTELIVAKYILPWFGGTPAVWNTCMLLYQSVLLLGYLYSHWLCSRMNAEKLRRIHARTLVIVLLCL